MHTLGNLVFQTIHQVLFKFTLFSKDTWVAQFRLQGEAKYVLHSYFSFNIVTH